MPQARIRLSGPSGRRPPHPFRLCSPCPRILACIPMCDRNARTAIVLCRAALKNGGTKGLASEPGLSGPERQAWPQRCIPSLPLSIQHTTGYYLQPASCFRSWLRECATYRFHQGRSQGRRRARDQGGWEARGLVTMSSYLFPCSFCPLHKV